MAGASPAYFIYVAMVSATGSILFGLDIGYLGQIWSNGHFKEWGGVENPFSPDSVYDGFTIGFVNGAFSVGAIIGSFPLVSTYFLENQGRKGTMFVGGCLFFIGAGVQVVAVFIHMISLGRFIAGVSIGLLSASIPLYQSEVAPPNWRGKLTSVYQLNITIGILLAQVINAIVLPLGTYAWRYVISIQLLPAAFMLIALPTLPYSPTWLIKQGRYDEAKQTLVKLRGEEDAGKEFEQLRKIDERDKSLGAPSWGELCANPRIRSLALVGAICQIAQQLCGMNVFMYFGPILFKKIGWNEAIAQSVLALNNVCSTLIGMVTIDILGRKFLFIIGGIVMATASLVMGIFASQYVLFASINIFVVAFASTWGPTAWVYCAEIYPSKYRSRLVGISTTSNWVGNTIVSSASSAGLNYLKSDFYFILVATNLINVGFGCFVPETKGVALQDVPALWDGKLPADPDQISDARKTA